MRLGLSGIPRFALASRHGERIVPTEMARPDQTEKTLEAAPVWPGVVRFCLGMLSLGAAICAGVGVYGYWVLFRYFGDHATILGLRVPYSILIPLLAALCLFSALLALYAFFFPTPPTHS